MKQSGSVRYGMQFLSCRFGLPIFLYAQTSAVPAQLLSSSNFICKLQNEAFLWMPSAELIGAELSVLALLGVSMVLSARGEPDPSAHPRAHLQYCSEEADMDPFL